MDKNPSRKVYQYKGHLVEYTGIRDDQNPVRVIFDKKTDCFRILISGSISPFLTDALAECVINQDKEGVKEILKKSGLKKEQEEPQLSARLKRELLEILGDG